RSRDLHRVVATTGKGWIDDLALGDEGRTVALVEAQVAVGMADGVAEQRFGPTQLAYQLFGVWVDQQLVGVETMPGFRLVGPINAVSIDLPRMSVGQVAVPDFIGIFRQNDALQLGFAAGVEQA